MSRLDPATLLDQHRRTQTRVRAELAPEPYEPPYTPEGGGGAVGTRVWVKVVTIYDEQDGGPGKHETYGRCLAIKRATLVFPTDGSDLTWTIAETEEIAFPDPIVLAALDQARADPEGLGEAIHLDDYYETEQLYKAEDVDGRLVVGREPFAIIGGPEYEAPG